MSDLLLDQYEEYLTDFHGWGHELFDKPLSLDEFEDLSVDLETICIEEDCGQLNDEQQRRREQIERQMLTHASYFADGPRVVITRPD